MCDLGPNRTSYIMCKNCPHLADNTKLINNVTQSRNERWGCRVVRGKCKRRMFSAIMTCVIDNVVVLLTELCHSPVQRPLQAAHTQIGIKNVGLRAKAIFAQLLHVVVEGRSIRVLAAQPVPSGTRPTASRERQKLSRDGVHESHVNDVCAQPLARVKDNCTTR